MHNMYQSLQLIKCSTKARMVGVACVSNAIEEVVDVQPDALVCRHQASPKIRKASGQDPGA